MVDRVSDDVGDLFDDLIEEAEGVRKRVREQASSHRHRHRRGFGRRTRHARGAGAVDPDPDADVEAELQRDESPESARTDDRRPAKAAADVDAAPTPARAAELFPDILGWQPLILNRDFECGRCQRHLAAGESAFLGLGEKGLTQTALCGRCAGTR